MTYDPDASMSTTTVSPEPTTTRRVSSSHSADSSVSSQTRLRNETTTHHAHAPNHRDKELEALCLRHSSRHEAAPQNHDVLYAWGLALQEQAERWESRREVGGSSEAQLASASSFKKESSQPFDKKREAYLTEACQKYTLATQIRGKFPSALYNHGIALGDLARLVGSRSTSEARVLWSEACGKYSEAVKAAIGDDESNHDDLVRSGSDDTTGDVSEGTANGTATSRKAMTGTATGRKAATNSGSTHDFSADTTRALNNWGLASQQLAGVSSDSTSRITNLLTAAGRFRAALNLDPGFHRACYNLGTVMFALSELALRRQRKLEGSGGAEERLKLEKATVDATRNESVWSGVLGETAPSDCASLRSAAAAYIAIARASVSGGGDGDQSARGDKDGDQSARGDEHGDQSARVAYANALRMVRLSLPKPWLRVGWLGVDRGGGRNEWSRTHDSSNVKPKQFALNGVTFGVVDVPGTRLTTGGTTGGTATATATATATGATSGTASTTTSGTTSGTASTTTPNLWSALDTLDPKEFFVRNDSKQHDDVIDDVVGTDKMAIPLASIQRVTRTTDVTGPPGFGFSIRTGSARGTCSEIWFAAATEADRDLWVDVISLAASLATRNQGGNLENELASHG